MTTKKKDRTKNDSAIPSWSGYNYQGKVALYSVLNFINNHMQADYTIYSLEIEWYEDFSIKKDNSYVSIHQVKSYKKKNLSEYKDAIWNLLGKSIDSKIPSTYLHTSENIDFISEIQRGLKNLKQPAGDENRKYTPAYYYKLIMDSGSYEKAFKSFSTYAYHTGNHYCEIDQIDNLIKKEIYKFYCSRNKKGTDEQIRRVFLCLLNILNEHITERHAKEQIHGSNIKPIKISFKIFFDVLDKNQEEASQDYYIFHLRNSFNSSCDTLIRNLFEKSNFERKDIKRAEDFLLEINRLNNQMFLEYCKKITPNVSAPKVNIENYRKLIPEEGLERALIVILMKINQKLSENYLFKRKTNNDNQFYLPTTISLDVDPLIPMDGLIGEIASNILDNEDLDEFLYEVDVMISRYINMDSLEISASKINKVPEIDPNINSDRYTRFTKIKDVKMINLEQAEKELKE